MDAEVRPCAAGDRVAIFALISYGAWDFRAKLIVGT